jgi:L-iditol 2-dehydrogenase
VTPATMRAARLHGIGDLRIESLPVPEPQPGEVLVRIEACGVCPTDARKFAIGVADGGYPLNPGHEWTGHVEALGRGVDGLEVGMRVYGDTYAGYAEYAAIATTPSGWSHGALALGDLPAERAIFVEPLADCLHCVHDQAAVRAGARVAVIGLGSMGVQIAAVAARAGADVLAVEPRPERRDLAAQFAGLTGVEPERWPQAAWERWDGDGPDAVVVTDARPEIAAEAISACAAGGRVVLFAGFGNHGVAHVDLNRIHYQEITVVGSEWIGVPPNARYEHYAAARELLAAGDLALERIISDRTGLAGMADALRAVREQRSFKTVLFPAEAR